MYKGVLVPLDGSELAECAFNHVKKMVKEGLAGKLGEKTITIMKRRRPWRDTQR
jgi:hypothetical protein